MAMANTNTGMMALGVLSRKKRQPTAGQPPSRQESLLGTPPPTGKPPPGAGGNIAPPVGSSTATNAASSVAQNPQRQVAPALGQSAFDAQKPESQMTAAQIMERNRRIREQNARNRGKAPGG